MAGCYDKVPDEWIRPTTWPPRKSVLERGPDAPHVVLSTKFQEPWKTISIGIKEILEELGCTVYNPNTDNKELWKEKADSRWLRTFQENLDRIEQSKRGFVLQIQQGVLREKSDMQVAEENMGKKWQVPRIGLFAFPTTSIRGGGTRAEQYLATAVQKAREQWEQGVKDEVQMVSEWYDPIGGDAELPVNDQGNMDGRARCTFPSGNMYEGDWKDGKRNGTGTHTFANGGVYVGEWKDDKRNGMGTQTFANGDVYVGEWKDGKKNGKGTYTHKSGNVTVSFFEEGEYKGRSVRLSASGEKAWLCMDGKVEREVSVAEARKVAKELGLPPLP
ncbi:PIP5K8 [Symbiodinium sp. CCMP2592]|nr:PIP5K8 [Symbiodinium sp. CCMP2592]